MGKSKKTIPMKLSLIFLLTLVPILAIGQLTGIGPSVGGAFSTFNYGSQVNTVDDFDYSDRSGGTGGIRFDFDLGTKIAKLSPEIFIIQNGSKEYYRDGSIITDLINRKVSLNYVGLYLPLTIYVPLGDDEKAYNGLFLRGKGFTDFAINGKIEQDNSKPSDVNFKEPSDRFDFGYSVEGGFVLNGFAFMFGYNWGLKNIKFANALGDINNANYLINNKGVTLTIGYIAKLQQDDDY